MSRLGDLSENFYFRSCSCGHLNLWPFCTPSLSSHITNSSLKASGRQLFYELLLNTFKVFEQHNPVSTVHCYQLNHLPQTTTTSESWGGGCFGGRDCTVPCICLPSLSHLLSHTAFCLSISISVSWAGPHNDRPAVYERTLPMRPLPVTSLFIGLYKPLAQGRGGRHYFKRRIVNGHLEG